MRLFSLKNYAQWTFLILYSQLGSILSAQTLPDKIAFEKYGVAEGLPEEAAMNLVQDEKGFIWATTQNGLVKFDGYKIKVLRGNEKNSTALQMRNLNGGLLKASNGQLWIGGVSGGGGLFSYDPKTEKFSNYQEDLADSSKVPYPNCLTIFEDIVGDIWFASWSADNEESFLCKINVKTKEVARYPYEVRGNTNDIVLNFQMAESKRDSSLWLNSDNSSKLMRYDRKKGSFELIFQNGDVLPGTQIFDSIQDVTPAGNSGLIPMGNNRHLYLWDPLKRKVVESYDFTSRKDTFWLGTAFEDSHGNIWNTSSDEVTMINREESKRDDYTFGQGVLAFKEAPKDIGSIIPNYQNEDFILFQIHSRDEPFTSHMRYDFNTEVFDYFDGKFNDQKNQFVQNGSDRRILVDQTGLLWMGTRPNMYKQAPKTRQIELYKNNPQNPGSIHNDSIEIFFQDSKARLWVGTRNGISLRSEENNYQQHYSSINKNPENSLGQIRQIYEDTKRRIWVATLGRGLFRWNESAKLFESIPFNPNARFIADIMEDAKGNIWVSGWTQGVYVLDAVSGKVIKKFEDEKKELHLLTSTRIFELFKDSRDQIWLGDPNDNDNGLFKYVAENERFKHYGANVQDSLSISSNEIRMMTEDDLGRMWVGTDGGLNLYDHDKDHFLQNNNKVSLPSVGSYAQAANGKMWFSAYSGDGLALVGPGVNDVEIFDETKGLLHNDISVRGQLPMDNFGKLWLTTERGLSVFDTKNRTYTSYFDEAGLQKYDEINASYKTKNGDIWIGGNEGINHIIPGKLAAKDSTLPTMVITHMGIMDSLYSAANGKLFKNAVPYTDHVTLNYTQRDLSFEFVALHYLKPEDNLYSWKLENYDTNWSAPSKERQAKYPNLSPGTYTFRVKGSNADGVWNEEGTSIQITIKPPWWLTWWAYILYALMLLYVGYRVHMYQRVRTLKKARENAQLIELEQAKEIKKAYADLKATQSQLIQAEKMASLGELTAGIAHEIKNPLNFVNNFSEVNRELIEELKEEKTKNQKERDSTLEEELLTDIDQNLEKISHHGKRADSIVKGMLQHSRASSGVKEPTDINTLADEYLRLAYHGLRAKDKSFNATMETDFDDKIGKIEIIQQDMGRVILNLITNAFHAVQEKSSFPKASEVSKYEPTVSVITKKVGNTIEIEVKDNGNGIPKKIIQRIFEPFFTTKPTGQGTGLGLSLSYDIVKAHGGELKVETKEGKGTTFIIQLPTL